MNDLAIQVVADREHRGMIQHLLEGKLSRVRICALNIHDVQLINITLSLRLKRLLASECTVTVAFGEELWDRDTFEPKNERCRQVIDFLWDLQEHGANVWYVGKPMLHAKVVYVEAGLADGRMRSRALVTSANLTPTAIGGGNYELGVSLDNLDAEGALQLKIWEFTDTVIKHGRSLEDVVQRV